MSAARSTARRLAAAPMATAPCIRSRPKRWEREASATYRRSTALFAAIAAFRPRRFAVPRRNPVLHPFVRPQVHREYRLIGRTPNRQRLIFSVLNPTITPERAGEAAADRGFGTAKQ